MKPHRLACFALLMTVCAHAPNRLAFGGENGITEGPDTVGSSLQAAAQLLGCTPDADGNADADVVYDPQNSWPLMVCARSAGSDRDIAFDEWRNDGWLPQPVFLTSSTLDEVDPRLHVDGAGTIYVAWWENAEPQSVLMARRPAGSRDWERPLLVTSSGRRPSVASWAGTVGVAFERDAPSGGQELVVATAGALGFSFAVVAVTPQSEPLDARLYAAEGRVWVEWDDADGRRVASELRGAKWSRAVPRRWISALASD